MAIAALLIVMLPMFGRRKFLHNLEEMFTVGDAKRLAYLNQKKESIYANIKELDFEYEMGQLSEEDFSRIRQGYLSEAQQVVKAIDEVRIKEEIEELIESEVSDRRRIK
jgi:hypothetical protein